MTSSSSNALTTDTIARSSLAKIYVHDRDATVKGSERTSQSVSRMVAFAMLLVLAAVVITWSVDRFHLRRPYLQSDLLAYTIAEEALSNGLNPYDPATIHAAWRARVGASDSHPLMVWNPPLIFLVPGILFEAPESHVFTLWPIVNVLSAALLALIGWNLSARKSLRALPLVVAALCCVPLLVEVHISQMSALLAVAPLAGVFCFMRHRDLSAGLLMSLSILKPHTLFVPFVMVSFWTVVERRWSVVVGSLVGLSLGFAIPELIFPGITAQWIFRETWPVNVYGSTLTSMLRHAVSARGFADPVVLVGVIPVIGVAGICLHLAKQARTPNTATLMWGLLLNQIVSPYGFMMDQTVLIVVQAFLVSHFASASTSIRALNLILVANLLTLGVFALAPSSLTSIWWITYPPLLSVSFWLLRDRSFMRPEAYQRDRQLPDNLDYFRQVPRLGAHADYQGDEIVSNVA